MKPVFEPIDLRRRAEAQIAQGDLPSKYNLDPIRQLHELQVHRVELELQNEELIAANTDGRSLGVLGEPGVNVLELNIAIDKEAPLP